MQTWKKVIFINAIKIRVRGGMKTVESVINSYPNLTDEEKEALRVEFSK